VGFLRGDWGLRRKEAHSRQVGVRTSTRLRYVPILEKAVRGRAVKRTKQRGTPIRGRGPPPEERDASNGRTPRKNVEQQEQAIVQSLKINRSSSIPVPKWGATGSGKENLGDPLGLALKEIL